MLTIFLNKQKELTIIDLPEPWVRSWNRYKRNKALRDPVSVKEFRLFLDMLTKWWRFRVPKKVISAFKKAISK